MRGQRRVVTQDPMKGLDVEAEQELAHSLRRTEERLRSALGGLPVAAKELRGKRRLVNRGRAGTVDTLERAVRVTVEAAKANPSDPELRSAARIARHGWVEVVRLRWQLAMSASNLAKIEARRRSGTFLQREDLVQEGFIGLVQAAMRFDPTRAIRFSTYARWWVRAQITRAIDLNGRSVRMPTGAIEQLRVLKARIGELEKAGESWDLQRISEDTGIEVPRARLLLSQGRTVSLDELDLKFSLHIVRDPGEPPDDLVYRRERMEKIGRAIDSVLSERQRYVLCRRFGLDGDDAVTLAQVGRELRVTKERVRQIERGALQRLRSKGGLRALDEHGQGARAKMG